MQEGAVGDLNRLAAVREGGDRRAGAQQARDGDVLAYQHTAPVHGEQDVAVGVDGEAQFGGAAGARRGRVAAQRLVVVRRRQRGEMAERRVGRRAAGAVDGEQGVDTGAQVGASGTRSRREVAGQRRVGGGDRDGRRPGECAVVVRRVDQGVRVRKRKPQAAGPECLDAAGDAAGDGDIAVGAAGRELRLQGLALVGDDDEAGRSVRRGKDDRHDVRRRPGVERAAFVAQRAEADLDRIAG